MPTNVYILPQPKKVKDNVPEIKEETVIISDATLPKSAKTVQKIGLEYGGTQGRSLIFREVEYDLSEIAAAYDTESYFRRACDKYVEQIWKQGWKIIGKDQRAVKYIRRRLKEVAIRTRTATTQLLEDISNQMVPYSNCFIVKKRDAERSTGDIRTGLNGKRLNPVAGYFVLDATSMKIARDTHGTVKKYQQFIPGNPDPAKEFKPEDMVHMYLYRKVGLAGGTPMVVPVLDDIRALRRMEENIEILVFQHAIPLIHYKVGTDEEPAGDEEIQNLRASIQEMPSNGVLLTPERHDIDVIGAEHASIRSEGYLNYFKQRIWAGLGMSGVSFGEGDTANRSTAITMDGNLQDTSQKFQRVIKLFFDTEIIDELLAEGGFQMDLEEEGRMVELFIPEIDLDKKTKVEAHNLLQFQGNALTHSELREAMGKDPLDDAEWKETQWEMIDKPKALIQAIDETSPFGKSDAQSGPTKAVKNASQPRNQSGTKIGTKPPVNANASIEDQISEQSVSLLDNLRYPGLKERLIGRYTQLKEQLLEMTDKDPEESDLVISFAALLTGLIDEAQKFVFDGFTSGVKVFSVDAQMNPTIQNIPFSMSILKEAYNFYLDKFVRDIQTRVESKLSNPISLSAAMDSMAFRLDFFARTTLMQAYNLGYATAARDSHIYTLKVENSSPDNTHDLCVGHVAHVDLTDLKLSEIPPFHVNCVCQLSAK